MSRENLKLKKVLRKGREKINENLNVYEIYEVLKEHHGILRKMKSGGADGADNSINGA